MEDKGKLLVETERKLQEYHGKYTDLLRRVKEAVDKMRLNRERLVHHEDNIIDLALDILCVYVPEAFEEEK